VFSDVLLLAGWPENPWFLKRTTLVAKMNTASSQYKTVLRGKDDQTLMLVMSIVNNDDR
jgi:hypothetical protein